MFKKWRIKKPAPQKFLESFPEFEPVILQLLYNRGIKTEEEIEKFLNPDWERDLHDPFLMKGMKEAVARLKKAASKKEKIGVFGHFDVDGIVSTVLLYSVFKKMGLAVSPYLPAREEGYGLSKEAVHQFYKEGVSLIVTADIGSTSFEAVEFANRLGTDVIITDHHEILKGKNQREKKPAAFAFINPHQKSCPYPFKELAGSGVVFKLVQALTQLQYSPLTPRDLKWLVDLVGLGTICDVVPLIDENRIFAKFGLIVLQKTKRLGLKELYKVAGINSSEIDTYTAGFLIGPRLNAPARLDHANASFYLLTTNEPAKAAELAFQLDRTNRERQAFLEKVLKEAKEEVEKGDHLKKKLILIGKESWPAGLIGLIAGRLKDEYCRPVIALAVGPQKSKGSARSIDALHITEVLAQCEEYLVRFGGHKKAAGFSVLTSNIKGLREKLWAIAEASLTDEDVTPQLDIEAQIPLSAVTWNLQKQLEKMEPTGLGNPKPVFMASGVRLKGVKVVGKNGQHLKLEIIDEKEQVLKALFFGRGDLGEKIRPSDIIKIAFEIAVDEWDNERRLILKIIDLRKEV